VKSGIHLRMNKHRKTFLYDFGLFGDSHHIHRNEFILMYNLTYAERIIFRFRLLINITSHGIICVNPAQNDILLPGVKLWPPYHPKHLHDKQAIHHQLMLIEVSLEVMIHKKWTEFPLMK
jgi:hypothetical protein